MASMGLGTAGGSQVGAAAGGVVAGGASPYVPKRARTFTSEARALVEFG